MFTQKIRLTSSWGAMFILAVVLSDAQRNNTRDSKGEFVAIFDRFFVMDPGKRPKIVIIGAGISGISAAKKLIDGKVGDVMILEASDRIGGRIHTKNFGGWTKFVCRLVCVDLLNKFNKCSAVGWHPDQTLPWRVSSVSGMAPCLPHESNAPKELSHLFTLYP